MPNKIIKIIIPFFAVFSSILTTNRFKIGIVKKRAKKAVNYQNLSYATGIAQLITSFFVTSILPPATVNKTDITKE